MPIDPTVLIETRSRRSDLVIQLENTCLHIVASDRDCWVSLHSTQPTGGTFSNLLFYFTNFYYLNIIGMSINISLYEASLITTIDDFLNEKLEF